MPLAPGFDSLQIRDWEYLTTVSGSIIVRTMMMKTTSSEYARGNAGSWCVFVIAHQPDPPRALD